MKLLFKSMMNISQDSAGDLSVSGLRRHPQRVCPCEMQRLRPRITSWPSPASGVVSTPPAIKNGWWNSGNGCAWISSRRFPTGILSRVPFRVSSSRRSSAVTFSEPVPYLIREPEASYRLKPLCMGIAEGLSLP